MSDRRKFERGYALTMARDIENRLRPFCDRLEIAGSLRRGRPYVGDIELLFIPKLAPDPTSMMGALFGSGEAAMLDLADLAIEGLLRGNFITKRAGVTGHCAWGPKNKLAVHTLSGIPVDFFSTTPANWWNSLVVRTGGKASNLAITMAANRQGYSFEAYGAGFHEILNPDNRVDMHSEEEIFEFVGLPYLPPEKRK